MRMRLGEFDPPEMVPYSKIAGTEEPWFSEKYKALARKATQESIVLLKNASNLLPLDKANVKSIAVIGALGNDVSIDWYAGIPPYTVSPLEGIKNKVGPGVHVRYLADNSNNSAAANLAGESDVAIVFVGNNPTCRGPFGGQCPPSEGKEAVDRQAIELEQAQNQLVQARTARESEDHRGADIQLSVLDERGAADRSGHSAHGALQPGGRQRAGGRAVRRLQPGRAARR